MFQNQSGRYVDPVADVAGRTLRKMLADGEWRQFTELARAAVTKTGLSEGVIHGEINRHVTTGKFVRDGARVRLRD